MIFGNKKTGNGTTAVPNGTLLTSTFVLGVDTLLLKLMAPFSIGPAGGQAVRGVVYSATGNLIATSNEVTPINPQADGYVWTDFRFSTPVALAAGTYQIGMFFGPNTSGSVFATGAPFDASDKTKTGTYPTTPATLSGTSSSSSRLSIIGVGVTPYVVPALVTDEYIASLPFEDAQAALSVGAPIDPLRGMVGWYGAFTDPKTGSYAIVQTDGIYSGLVGERVKITYDERSVFAVIHEEKSILEDIALSRRAFLKIAQTNDAALDGVVEIVQ